MNEQSYPYDVVVYIGRFEPYHTGHHALVHQALALGRQVVLVLGSAGEPRSRKNPFFAAEREAMIAASVAGADAQRLLFTAVQDFGDNDAWVAAVHAAVESKAPGAARVALIGHFKDASSYYLNHFPSWRLESVGRANELDATTVRNVMFDHTRTLEARLQTLQDMVPAGALTFIKQWMTTEGFRTLADADAPSARLLETAQA
ncbi:hypothetical protein WJ97_12695 [Burkholderia ubonensis]|uniref:adenylyltransferase/cytidyltransferase family protein n=1 Tax=Burkholderia ubonensis TaxID=101571 RepID=UPI000755866B|nr:adenylyltransferase/cytidyltransferase family protein [Burkholderia ubonensis]KVP96732.1 hypothetical protein WJ97_12695 [Burkholderia ubonensis]